MGIKKKSLSLSEIKPGMVTETEIRSEGRVLVAKDIVITEEILGKLKEHYIYDNIEVYWKDGEFSSNNIAIKQRTVEEIEESFNEFSFELEDLFDNIYNIKVTGLEEIRNFTKRIQEEFKSTSAVIKNVVLYGSGKDVLYRHCINVSALSFILGKWMGLTDNELNLLTYAAIFHDFGKTKINSNILTKEKPLTSAELKELKKHPAIGYNFIKEIPYLDKSVSYGVLMHHERLDGSGYPLGIKEDKIHKFAKIIAIVDVFDAINSDRVYKKSTGPFQALEIIKRESLKGLDYEYCNVFLTHAISYYIGEQVMLSNGEVYRIVKIDINDIARPLLVNNMDFLDLKKEKDLFVEKLIL